MSATVCCSVLTTTTEFTELKLGVESNWNSFEIHSIQKFAIRLIRKGKKIFEKFDEN